jgi:hypothetical protein
MASAVRSRILSMAALALLALPTAAELSSPPARAWQPGELERVQISLQSYRFFQAIDQADYLAAFGTYASAISRRLKFKDWKQRHEALRLQTGADISRNITRITWYPSPDAQDPSRMIAASSFTGKSKSLAVYCGRLLWQRSTQGGFELIGEESGFVSQQQAKALSAKALQKRRDELGCIGNG